MKTKFVVAFPESHEALDAWYNKISWVFDSCNFKALWSKFLKKDASFIVINFLGVLVLCFWTDFEGFT